VDEVLLLEELLQSRSLPIGFASELEGIKLEEAAERLPLCSWRTWK